MQQLTCLGPNKLEWQDVPEPRIAGDGEALVRPVAVARCDIDRFLTSGLFPLRGPFALGHECVGEVTALGDAVRGLSIGQRVVVSFQVSCGICPTCEAGRTAICAQWPTLSDYGMQPLSGVEYGGMLSDRIRVPHADAMLQPISASLDPLALASASENVPDGYRAVALHLAALPGSELLIAAHGLPSIPLYAAQAALASARAASTLPARTRSSSRSRSGSAPIPSRRTSKAGLRAAIPSSSMRASQRPVSITRFAPPSRRALPERQLPRGSRRRCSLGRMYTLGIRLFAGRCHAAALLPEVVASIEAKRLRLN